MPVASVIVESLPGAAAHTGASLTAMAGVSVYGIKEDQIVTVIEADSPAVIDLVMRQIKAMTNVIGLYPVYVGGYED